jgi:hypothetical protein
MSNFNPYSTAYNNYDIQGHLYPEVGNGQPYNEEVEGVDDEYSENPQEYDENLQSEEFDLEHPVQGLVLGL